MAGESIKFNAGINTAGFDSGAKHLQSVAASASASIAGHFGKIATAVVGIGAAFIGVRAAVQAFSAAIEMGGKLNDLAARTGETAGNLAILQRAFQNAGAGADAVGPTINRLQRAIIEAGEGGKQQALAFEKLGLSLSEIKELTPTQQLEAVAKALQGVSNDSDRGAIAMQLLGRSGGELLPLLRAMGSELQVARDQLGGLPGVMDRTNRAFDTIGDNLGAISAKTTEFAAGLLEKVAPALAEFTTRLATIDAAGFGAKLSEYLQKTVNWIVETFKLKEALNQVEVAIKGITSGNFGDGLKLLFMAGRDAAFNAINQIVAAAMAGLSSVTSAFSKMFDANGALVLLLKTSFTIAANFFTEKMYLALADFMEAIGRSGMAETFRYQAETAAKQIETLTFSIGSVVEEVGEQAKETFAGIPTAFQEAYKQNLESPLLEMKDRTAETAEQMEKVAAATRAAAFDAEKFGKALADARLDRLGAPAPGDFELKPGAAPGIFGMNPDALPAIAPTAGGGIGGGIGGGGIGGAAPKTAADYETQMRANAASRRHLDRARGLEERGMYDAAARAMERADQAAQKVRDRADVSAYIRDQYDAGNMGEAYEKYRDNTGLDRKSREDFERDIRSKALSDEERKRREEEGSGGSGGRGRGAAPAGADLATEATLKLILDKIQERPILVA